MRIDEIARSGAPVKVLAVDDDPDFAKILKSTLALSGGHDYVIESAVTQAEAVEKLGRKIYDVVTVDIVLPDANGLDLLDRIVHFEDAPPVIVSTGHGGEKIASRSFELGASGYVMKDREMSVKLPQAINRAVEKEAERKALAAADGECSLALTTIGRLGAVFFIVDADGWLVRWNHRLSQLTGRTDEELRAMNVADMVSGWEAFPGSAPDGGNRYFLGGIVKSDREAVPCEFVVGTHAEIDGSPAGTFVLAKEYHPGGDGERNSPGFRDEAALSSDRTGEAIFKANFDGVITYANEIGAQLTGHERDTFTSVRLEDVIHPEDIGELFGVLMLAQRELRLITGVETRFLTAGIWRFMEWNVSPEFNSHGECGGYQLTGRDVTEKHRTEEFLNQIICELDYYAHTVSHDLRGPLTAVMAAADTLRQLVYNMQSPDVTEEVMLMSQIISDNTEKVGHMVIDMLSLAESAQRPEEVEDVQVSGLVKAVLTELAPVIENRGVRMSVDEDMGTVSANRLQMYQLFSNLIRNGLEHNDSQAPRMLIQHLGSASGYHRFAVCDNGSGVPESQKNRIFAPFFKGQAGGTGIGLSTVQRIVKAYNGYINIHNRGGACFEFCIRDADPADTAPAAGAAGLGGVTGPGRLTEEQGAWA